MWFVVVAAFVRGGVAAAPPPRWCGGVAAAVAGTRARLGAKYGAARLDRASIFSHNASAVAARLLAALETRRPFRVGVVSGSHAVSYETGMWSANVTRWLDAVFGAAADGEGYARLVDGAACAGRGGNPYGARLGHGCARFPESRAEWAWEPPAFCADAGTWHGDEGAAWHASD
ncbi:hypothetical protein M885DRAFT_581350 [Pelagophyceae sp. CCMP2097]|nr:hypothetical protein M885DRAFT_581350 [Pelagophyceae sp. CCMP2097]